MSVTPARVLAVFVLLCCCFAVGACGGGGGDGGGESNDEAGLRQAVNETFQYFVDGKFDDMYARFTNDCRERMSAAEFKRELLVGVAFIEAFTESDISDLGIKEVQVRNVSNGSGEAAVSFDAPEGSGFDEDEADFEEWRYEDGQWRSTSCDETGFVSSGDGGDGDSVGFFDTPVPADWDVEFQPSGAREDQGGVVLTIDAVRIGTPEGVRGDDVPDDWADAESVVLFEVTMENTTGGAVNLDAYFSKAVVDGLQLDVDSFASDIESEVLAHARVKMRLYVPVPDEQPDSIRSLSLSMGAAHEQEEYQPLGNDYLIEVEVP